MMVDMIHAIWLGDRMPALSHACLDDWSKMGFEFQLWTDSDDRIQGWINSCEFAKKCYKRGLYAFVSDYLRLKILQEVGGLYLDTDVTIRRNPFPLFANSKFVICHETEEYLGTAAIYAESDSKILSELISFYENDIWRSHLYIGPQIATHVIKARGLYESEPCKILPAVYFYPYQQEPLRFECPKDSYLVHWFQHSWKRSPGMAFLKAKHLGLMGRIYVWQKYFFRRFS